MADKQSLDPSEGTKETAKQALKDQWSHPAAEEKMVHQNWAMWDKMWLQIVAKGAPSIIQADFIPA